MQRRRFGRTEHFSTIAIFGGFALSQATSVETDRIMEQILQSGINHIDIAPSYGHAEIQLGTWLNKTNTREQFFLGCKTMERSYKSAKTELHQSLKRLKTSFFDLYQIHAITCLEELNQVTRSGGALDAIIEAREAGLTKYIGITGHGIKSPELFIEALNRFDFDSVLFPVNFILYYNDDYKNSAEILLKSCKELNIGTMAIKAISKGPWGDMKPTHITWYKPFTRDENIRRAIDFVLSQDVTGICTAGDPNLLPAVTRACEQFTPMPQHDQDELIASAYAYEPLFA